MSAPGARGRTPVGCFPGSFDPLTVAHLAIADAAVEQCGLERLDLVLSEDALGKPSHHHPLDERVAIIRAASVEGRPWLDARVTQSRLLADIAEGYDVLVLGADKWAQLHDLSFYDSASHRDEALARLPRVVCAPRAGAPTPAGVDELVVPDWVRGVSSTAVRNGADEWRAVPLGRSGTSLQTRRNPE
ncbi:MAG TPA: hypothetical protein VM345_04350 [Acidimicrobiales bacterium]|nr:hypothetical protein [Acidimicrobiales bacterium]